VKPLSALDVETARGLRGLLFDLDDTLLSHGTLTREAYGALWDLHDAGLRLVIVTGRPSGWGEVLVRQWPVDGAVTENGAVHVVREGRGVAIRERCTPEERASRRTRLAALASRVRELVPEARLADDVAARVSDITWDIGERVRLAPESVARITAEIARAGARSTRSSVHLHATFDEDDKASGAVDFLSRSLGEDSGAARTHYAFAGDSGNDAACFAAFRTTFAVANVAPYLGRMPVGPTFVATSEMGTGFAEIAAAMLGLRARQSSPMT
jgi:HAD superfamily hydrolase (TIGR01484 family)